MVFSVRSRIAKAKARRPDSSACPNCLRTSPGVSSVIERHFEIHPNPATDRLIIDGNLSNEYVQIWNAFGQVVYRHRINNMPFEIDTSRLPSGFYFIEVKGKRIRKFVKL